MRPPVLPSGNEPPLPPHRPHPRASMRPPVLPSGNRAHPGNPRPSDDRFNEAAGFTQRKRGSVNPCKDASFPRFNEAAGFTQRKHNKADGNMPAVSALLQ